MEYCTDCYRPDESGGGAGLCWGEDEGDWSSDDGADDDTDDGASYCGSDGSVDGEVAALMLLNGGGGESDGCEDLLDAVRSPYGASFMSPPISPLWRVPNGTLLHSPSVQCAPTPCCTP